MMLLMCFLNNVERIIKMHISKIINSDGSMELYFEKVGHWDDFELILKLLQQENDCKILSNEEMIYIRQAKLLWNSISFELIQDDMLGNFISSSNPYDFDKLEVLASNVLDSIKEKLN